MRTALRIAELALLALAFVLLETIDRTPDSDPSGLPD
jgi:hypothetical protein